RRGYTPEAIKNFIIATGLSRINSTVESDMLEHFLREDLKLKAKRLMAVIDPLKVIVTNYPEGQVEYLDAPNNVENPELGSRKVAFSRHLYIDRNDFALEKPDKHYKRLALGLEVRLFNAYFIKAYDVQYDKNGNIEAVLCTYDPETKSGSGFNARKPNGTIHYVEATTARPAVFNLFEPLIIDDEADQRSFLERLNPNSWIVKEGYLENAQEEFKELERFQFIREGYFAVDKTSTPERPVFNRIVSLKSAFK
ncbi:MAG TPA: glutamine--tRNA ligase, partial [Acholeplasmataceae bacterium]|nr:glutamine--tRNA ligase [Acholeplasmataceae bacterium]